MLPEAFPSALGVNNAVNEAVAPMLSVTGTFRPPIVNPAPDADAPETVTLADPEFRIVTVCVATDPTGTLPKPGVAEVESVPTAGRCRRLALALVVSVRPVNTNIASARTRTHAL